MSHIISRQLNCIVPRTAGFWVFLATLAIDTVLGCNSAFAQLQPDNTLGNEGSVVQPIDQFNDQIDGGAFRGRNLFHSFREFNVGEGRGVYFANPTGIENILSRVTGQNSSQILGRLGVLGEANLFFLNPNGIVFGPNASLDISGSFHASTASGISLGDQGFFSASQPEESRLLSMNPGVLFFNQAAAEPGSIINQGQLSVGERQSLSLSGNSVHHIGTLKAPSGLVALQGNQVSLQDQARIDTSSSTSGGTVIIGGEASKNNTNLSTSRTFIGPEVTINANTVSHGDGGQVEVLGDEVTEFYGKINARGGSLSGDGGFVGVSGKNHVIFRGTLDTSATEGSGGSFLLNARKIIIANGSEDESGDEPNSVTENESNVTRSFFSLPLSVIDDTEAVTIYETELERIAGNTNVELQAVNDIQVEDIADDELNFARGNSAIQLIADSDRDGVGAIIIKDSENDTLKTNGRNISISGETLSLGNINTTKKSEDGGIIILNANNDITIDGYLASFANFIEKNPVDGGNIYISSVSGNITTFKKIDSSVSRNIAGKLTTDSLDNFGKGGNISISSISGDIINNGGLNNNYFEEQYDRRVNHGNITISTISGNIVNNNSINSTNHSDKGKGISISSIGGDIINNASLNSFTGFNSAEDGGNISISTVSGDITNNGNLQTSYRYNFGAVKGGDITISSVSGNIKNNGALYSGTLYGRGDGGDITISSISGNIKNRGQLDTSNSGFTEGDGGDITISSISGDIRNDAVLSSGANYDAFYLYEAGDGGDITISSISGDIKNHGELFSALGGNGGSILISSISGDIENNARLISSLGGESNSYSSGDITITSISGDINNNGDLFSTNGLGDGGDISISSISGDIKNNGELNSSANRGDGGNIAISSISGDIENGSIRLNSSAFSGDGGNVDISSNLGNISLNNSTVETISFSTENSFSQDTQGGKIILLANNGAINGQNSKLTTVSIAENGHTTGYGGEVTLRGKQISGLEIATLSSSGESGLIKIQGIGDKSEMSDLRLHTGGDLEVEIPNSFSIMTKIINLDRLSQSGNTIITSTGNLTLKNVEIQSDTNSIKNAGNITIASPNYISMIDSQITSTTVSSGNAGNIEILAGKGITILGTDKGINASSAGEGNAGLISIYAPLSVNLGTQTNLSVQSSNLGKSGDINVTTDSLTIGTDAELSATATATSTSKDGGNITINASNLDISGKLGIFAETKGQAPAGTLTINPDSKKPNLNIQFTENGFISASTTANGPGGDITIRAPQAIDISGAGKIAVETDGSGDAGNIDLKAQTLTLTDGVEITASSTSQGNSGDIKLDVSGLFKATNSDITTTARKASGGDITISATDIQLKNSDIETNVATGKGVGGNIILRAKSILAFEDSDIFASATDGSGGDINIDTPIFIGEGFTLFSQEIDSTLLVEGNGVVNINATGAISTGSITTPDVSFIEESLTELPEARINTTDLIANSCIVRTNVKEGKFIVTGAGGVPDRPGNVGVGSFPTGMVQSVSQHNSASQTNPIRTWEEDDPIIEPQGVYRLADGKIVMSRECS